MNRDQSDEKAVEFVHEFGRRKRLAQEARCAGLARLLLDCSRSEGGDQNDRRSGISLQLSGELNSTGSRHLHIAYDATHVFEGRGTQQEVGRCKGCNVVAHAGHQRFEGEADIVVVIDHGDQGWRRREVLHLGHAVIIPFVQRSGTATDARRLLVAGWESEA